MTEQENRILFALIEPEREYEYFCEEYPDFTLPAGSYSEATEDKMPESSKKDASPLNEICQGLGCSCTSPDAYAHPERCEIVRKFVRYMTKNQQDLDPEIAKLINKHFWELT